MGVVLRGSGAYGLLSNGDGWMQRTLRDRQRDARLAPQVPVRQTPEVAVTAGSVDVMSDRATPIFASLSAGERDGTSEPASLAIEAAAHVAAFGADVGATLRWAAAVGASAPQVGQGSTRGLWELLASTAALSVSAARMLEPHLDALSILNQSGADITGIGADLASTWGVYAAEGPGVRLTATRERGAWTLTGTKPWCSLANDLSHALVTAWIDDSRRQLFAVDLRSAGVHPRSDGWAARGLPHVISQPVSFVGAHAVPVGEGEWYLSRPGFAWGGMSVAACWWGGAVGVAASVSASASAERADQVSQLHLGRVDAALWAARAVLAEAATLIDSGASADVGERLLAARVRAVVVDAATLTLAEADAALGPAPLVHDPAHAARVSDLHLYLRQHHGLRDMAKLGHMAQAGPR